MVWDEDPKLDPVEIDQWETLDVKFHITACLHFAKPYVFPIKILHTSILKPSYAMYFNCVSGLRLPILLIRFQFSS